MKTCQLRYKTAACLATLALGSWAHADVLSVEISERATIQGLTFGESGEYEYLTGRLHFAFDPASPANAGITDIELAPLDPNGRVRADADLLVLQPVDPALRSGTALLEVSNRGGSAGLRYFQNASRGAAVPSAPEHLGDGLLMRRGVTWIWVGWQFDVPDTPGRIRLTAPELTAGPDGAPITGAVRCDWVVDAATSTLELGHRGHVPYRVHAPDSPAHVLTWRSGRLAPRRTLRREEWRFVTPEGADRPTAIELEGGFAPGLVFELVYIGVDPSLVGAGLLAIRDTAAFAKSGREDCPFGVERVVAYGISQTGRFLRTYLYEGVDLDEHGQRAIDGMLIHTAGAGRGSFDHRFAQPSRDAHRYSAFFYPTDLFPFSGTPQTDPLTGRTEGLYDRLQGTPPKLFYTNTGYEYWGRAAALIHTTLDGTADLELLPHERAYHLASAQHYVGGFPHPTRSKLEGVHAWRGNPLDFLPTLRCLLVALIEWVEDDAAPPPSAVPRIGDGSLVQLGELRLPALGLPAPRVAHEAYRADYGGRFLSAGIVDRQPPRLGAPFPVLVPALDELDNERGGVRVPALDAPLATYLPYASRAGLPGPGFELRDFEGTFVPLAWTEEDANTNGSARPDVTTLYGDREGYERALLEAALAAVGRRHLLDEDVGRVLQRGLATWDWIEARR